jgi:predicted nucleotidyltransferase
MVEGFVTTLVRFLKEQLKHDGIPVEQVILFGSASRAEMGAESDIDIAIISPAFQGKNIFERADMTADAELACIRKFRVPLDIITLTREELQAPSSLIACSVREGTKV